MPSSKEVDVHADSESLLFGYRREQGVIVDLMPETRALLSRKKPDVEAHMPPKRPGVPVWEEEWKEKEWDQAVKKSIEKDTKVKENRRLQEYDGDAASTWDEQDTVAHGNPIKPIRPDSVEEWKKIEQRVKEEDGRERRRQLPRPGDWSIEQIEDDVEAHALDKGIKGKVDNGKHSGKAAITRQEGEVLWKMTEWETGTGLPKETTEAKKGGSSQTK